MVATQLTSNITKWLILTDPYRIKSPAEIIKTSFQMPVGMQLLQVYIEEDIYEDLKFEATSLQSIHYCLQNKDLNVSFYSFSISRDNYFTYRYQLKPVKLRNQY